MELQDFSKFTEGFDSSLIPEYIETMATLSLEEYSEFVDIIDKLDRNDEAFQSISQIHMSAIKKDKDYEKKYMDLVKMRDPSQS